MKTEEKLTAHESDTSISVNIDEKSDWFAKPLTTLLSDYEMIKYHDIIYDYPLQFHDLKAIYIQNAQDNEDYICKKVEDIFSETNEKSKLSIVAFKLWEWEKEPENLLSMIDFLSDKYMIYVMTNLTQWEFVKTPFRSLLASEAIVELYDSFNDKDYIYRRKE